MAERDHGQHAVRERFSSKTTTNHRLAESVGYLFDLKTITEIDSTTGYGRSVVVWSALSVEKNKLSINRRCIIFQIIHRQLIGIKMT